MARLVIAVDVEGIDPTLVDPHDVADALLAPEHLHHLDPGGSSTAQFAGAEWAPAPAPDVTIERVGP